MGTEFDRRTYTVTEAAKIIGISRSLAYQMANEGRLPTILVGVRRKVIPKVALEQWLLDEAKVKCILTTNSDSWKSRCIGKLIDLISSKT